jgi:glutathionyl-hydroquinone reductase
MGKRVNGVWRTSTEPTRIGPEGDFVRGRTSFRDRVTQTGTHTHRVYSLADDTYSGSATVPVLWDRKLGTIVSNESAEIIEMLNVTLADIRLFTTLIRFDAVYYGHFKCNRIAEFENLWPYLRDRYQTPGIGQTVDIDLYKRGYYGRSPGINPRGIIPVGPRINFEAPHRRA